MNSKNLITINILIFLISSSVGKSLIKKRDVDNSEDYYDEVPETSSEKSRGHPQDDSGECEEKFIPYVNCLHDKIVIVLSHETHDGKFFVSDHLQERGCSKHFSKSSTNTTLEIPFEKCGLKKSAEVVMNITVLPQHNLKSDDAATIPIRCPYPPYNGAVSDELPEKVIAYKYHEAANGTEPPKPKYTMAITEKEGPKNKKIVQADIKISPKIPNARAKNCYVYAKNNTSLRQELTNSGGCTVNPKIFPGWSWNPEENKLTSEFPSFELIGADKTALNCTVEVCYTDTSCGPSCPKADSQRRKCKDKSH